MGPTTHTRIKPFDVGIQVLQTKSKGQTTEHKASTEYCYDGGMEVLYDKPQRHGISI